MDKNIQILHVHGYYQKEQTENVGKKIPKVSTKVIRVSSCRSCLYPDWDCLPPYVPCKHPDMVSGFNVNSFIFKKTLPAECPLEDEEGINSPALKQCRLTLNNENRRSK